MHVKQLGTCRAAMYKIVCLVALLCGLLHGVNCADKARYDYYRIYRVHLETEEHVKLFQELEQRSDSYMFIGHALQPNQELSILVSAHKVGEITDLLELNNVTAKVLVENFQSFIDAEEKHTKPIDTPAEDFGWADYYHLETIHAWLDSLTVKYKNIVTPLDAGKSYNGLPLKGVKVSYKANNTGIFVEGGIHAREWISPATSTYILNQLLTSNDSDVRYIAEHFDWYFFPVFNPDGYKATFERDRMWRKTRQPFGVCMGTDLNRNWDSNWNETGASSDPCRYDFAGPSVFSEPESKQLSDYLIKLAKPAHLQTYLSLHSYSQLLMFPHAATADPVPNYDDLKAIGMETIAAIAKRHGTVYRTGSVYETIYPSSGSSHDWAYTVLKTPISYTFELRGPPTSINLFILPAEEIIPVGEETLDGFVALLKAAKERGYYNYEKIVAAEQGSAASTFKAIGLMPLFLVLVCSQIFDW